MIQQFEICSKPLPYIPTALLPGSLAVGKAAAPSRWKLRHRCKRSPYADVEMDRIGEAARQLQLQCQHFASRLHWILASARSPTTQSLS